MAWPNTGAISLSIVKSVSLTDSNDEGYNGGGAHPRVCTLLGLSVSLSAATTFGSGWSHYAITCLLATRDARQLFNRGGGCVRESSHRGQDRHQSAHSSICVSPG